MCIHLATLTLQLLLISNITFAISGLNPSVPSDCSVALSKIKGKDFRNLDVPSLRVALDPSSGTGVHDFSVKDYFTASFTETLYDQLPKGKGTIWLIENYEQTDHSTDMSNSAVALLKPIFEYANAVVELINESLPAPERNLMKIENMHIAISTGSEKQGGDLWHIDNARYMTFVTNLFGNGTKVDASGAKFFEPGSFGDGAPASSRSIEVNSAVIFNGGIRNVFFPGPGSYPISHRAPDGSDAPRLSLIVFIAPKKMNAPKTGSTIRNMLPSDLSGYIETLRPLYFNQGR